MGQRVSNKKLMEYRKRADMAAQVTLPADVFRDLLDDLIDTRDEDTQDEQPQTTTLQALDALALALPDDFVWPGELRSLYNQAVARNRQLVDSLVDALCNPENQPHQWIGHPEELIKLL